MSERGGLAALARGQGAVKMPLNATIRPLQGVRLERREDESKFARSMRKQGFCTVSLERMDALQTSQQARQNADPPDAGDVLVLVLCVAYMIAAMAASVYLVCDGGARMDVFSFIALWLRELVMLVLIAVALFFLAAVKVGNALDAWFRTREKRPTGENAP